MLPSGCAQLVFALHDRPIAWRSGASTAAPVWWTGGVVHGPQWAYYLAGPKPPGIVAGVSFKPGAAAILGVAAMALTDQHVSVEDLWGAHGRHVQERLREADSADAVFELLERELYARLERPILIHPAVAQALRAAGPGGSTRRVSEIQRESRYSARHFNALFKSAVGITPKHYCRLQRFTAALRCRAAVPAPDLAAIAAIAGYSDQSHMTREFREFAGISPAQYRPEGPDRIFHHRAPSPQEIAPRATGQKHSRFAPA